MIPKIMASSELDAPPGASVDPSIARLPYQ
jgi:hypothetical protein